MTDPVDRDALLAFIATIHPDGIPCVCVAAILDYLDGGEALATNTMHWDTNAMLNRLPAIERLA